MTNTEHHFNAQTARNMANSLKNAIRQQVECGHSRSQKANLMEMAINLSGYKQMLANPQRLQKAIQEAGQQAQQPYRFPKGLQMTNQVQQSKLQDLPIVTIKPQGHPKELMVYLCGGAYFQQPSKRHWEFLDQLASVTKQEILVPLLPQLPLADVKQAFQNLAILYRALYNQHPATNINLAGDSSGAGLALAFCEQLGEKQLPQPGHLILISPWLDLDLKNPLIAKYAKKDVMLDPRGLRTLGKQWAGDVDHDSYLVSPINGDLKPLNNVLLFAGTREIMLPDVMSLTEKLRASNVNVDCVISREMYHTYPIYPTIEGQQALQKIHDFCQK